MTGRTPLISHPIGSKALLDFKTSVSELHKQFNETLR